MAEHAAWTIERLGEANLTTWSDKQLGMWCYKAPHLLLAPPWVIVDLTDYPREKGPPTKKELAKSLDAIAHWAVVLQLADRPDLWPIVVIWFLSNLYPEYTHRFGKDHACQARVEWLAEHLDPTQILPNLEAAMSDSTPTANRREAVNLDELRELGGITMIRRKPYVNHAGLVRLAHNHGIRSVRITRILAHDIASGFCMVEATAEGDRGTFVDIADASPENTDIKNATPRIASTRAINRALRLYLGIGMTSVEELPGRADEDTTPPQQQRATNPPARHQHTSAPAAAAPKPHADWNKAAEQAAIRLLEPRQITLPMVAHFLDFKGWPRLEEMSAKRRKECLAWICENAGDVVYQSGNAGKKGAA